ncbi:MAG: hypothetical protein R2856_11350 [Caldilineaceae bacterium]
MELRPQSVTQRRASGWGERFVLMGGLLTMIGLLLAPLASLAWRSSSGRRRLHAGFLPGVDGEPAWQRLLRAADCGGAQLVVDRPIDGGAEPVSGCDQRLSAGASRSRVTAVLDPCLLPLGTSR